MTLPYEQHEWSERRNRFRGAVDRRLGHAAPRKFGDALLIGHHHRPVHHVP